MEAALFVSSGTMGNLLSILCHCSQNGSEFICGDNAHIYYYEGGTYGAAGHARCLGCVPAVHRHIKVRIDGLPLQVDLHRWLAPTHARCPTGLTAPSTWSRSSTASVRTTPTSRKRA